MKTIRFSEEKNQLLKQSRGFGFLEVFYNGKIRDVRRNPKLEYEHQSQFIVEYDRYIWIIPFVEEDEYIFLKTMYKSRKLLKLYPLTQ